MSKVVGEYLQPLNPGIHQGLLAHLINGIFPNEEVIVDSRKKSSIKDPSTGAYIEVDIYLPRLKLGFEFQLQDSYHYVTTWYSHRPLVQVQEVDHVKKLMWHKLGNTFIVIPFWWDGTSESLNADIHFHRPDVLSLSKPHLPIPLNPLPSHSACMYQTSKNPAIPEVGELMAASFPYNSSVFCESISVDNAWWMGEKYDGIRCCWHPNDKQMYPASRKKKEEKEKEKGKEKEKSDKKRYTRTGKDLGILDSIARSFPNSFLDTELWFGRGKYNDSQRLINEGDFSLISWSTLRLNSFDIPSRDMRARPFEYRYSHLLSISSPTHPIIIIPSRRMCEREEELSIFLFCILAHGGEGAILRKPRSLYEQGRTNSLLKLKGSQGDKEAIVIGRGEDACIQLKMPDGLIFSVPLRNVLVPGLKIGDVVTYSYESYARREAPVNPTIFRIRTDVDWEDVVRNSRMEITEAQASATPVYTKQPQFYWTNRTMRLFLEEYAKKRNLDPLTPQTWYTIVPTDIAKTKGGSTILDNFRGYINLLRAIFPDIGLNFEDLSKHHRLYSWSDFANRRKFFEEFAKARGFDPRIPDNWYAQSRELILSFPGGSSILKYHKGSMAQALVDIFPDIGLDRSVFYRGFYSEVGNQRKFFENYAKQHGFDPLKPENWYKQRRKTIISTKGALGAVYKHNNSVPNALCNVFPNIGLVKSQFYKEKRHMNSERRALEELAVRKGIGAADKWYDQSREELLAVKGAPTIIMNYYNGDLAEALENIFPEIGLDNSKFGEKRRSVQKR